MENSLNLDKNDIGLVKEFNVKVGFFGRLLSHDKKFYNMVKGEFKIIGITYDVHKGFTKYKVTLNETVYDIESTIKLMATGLDLEVKFI